MSGFVEEASSAISEERTTTNNIDIYLNVLCTKIRAESASKPCVLSNIEGDIIIIAIRLNLPESVRCCH